MKLSRMTSSLWARWNCSSEFENVSAIRLRHSSREMDPSSAALIISAVALIDFEQRDAIDHIREFRMSSGSASNRFSTRLFIQFVYHDSKAAFRAALPAGSSSDLMLLSPETTTAQRASFFADTAGPVGFATPTISSQIIFRSSDR